MELRELLVPAAVLGPAAAAAVWLAAGWWPWPRRVAAAIVWLASQVAAWAVFWEAFRGEPSSWMGLSPDLLRATLAAVAGVAVTLVLPRLDVLPPRAAAAGVVAAGVGLTAVIGAAYSPSLVAVAVLAPVPTLAVALAAIVGDRPRGLPGLVGLAAADALVLGGLLVLLDRSATTVLASVEPVDPGVMLLLAGSALKLGAVPHLAAWRMGASEGLAAPLAVVVRAQGAVLASAAVFTIAGAAPSTPLAAVAAGLTLIGGAAALVSTTPGGALSGLAGAGAGALLVALGLGGGVGARAGLLLLPPLVLASGVTAAAGWPGADDPHDPRPAWRWAGLLALGVGAASLAGLPPAGGFPGTWLSLSLATTRGLVEPWNLLVLVAAASGLLLAALAAVPALRVARTRPAAAVLASLGALALLYAGAQPLRLGLGWLLRVERELGLPEVLPSAGSPALPPIGGVDLAWAALPAVAIVAAVVVLGRGVRDPATEHDPLVTLPPVRPPSWAGRALGVARRLHVGEALAALIEAAAVAAAAWIVLRGMELGFL